MCITIYNDNVDQVATYCDSIIIGGINTINNDKLTSYIFRVYPNPAKSFVTIVYELPSSGNTEISVYDFTGREVAVVLKEKQVQGKYNIVWNCLDLKAGVYILKLETKNKLLVKKVLITK